MTKKQFNFSLDKKKNFTESKEWLSSQTVGRTEMRYLPYCLCLALHCMSALFPATAVWFPPCDGEYGR